MKKLLQQVGASKAEIPQERKLLQVYLSSLEFIEDLYALYERSISLEHEMEMEAEKTVDFQRLIRSVHDPFSILFDESKPFLQEIIKLNAKYESVQHSDPQIAEVANNYLRFSWVK